ncbi:hypothetical protein OCI51_26620 (plasmid) [Lysinibacillus capsici]|uniref:hypothetical protein n=1 Tax=Lysinibacillus capsici TaxID=2115968 RepID=UPI0021DB4AC0|nr:hypothetical protein [Lysinibacillus capsici]UYB50181.1 hypothetical protein OCI51_26995 [Lysinibacillus capsici]UYB50258.1 hypothetical protein OCI51_26620 [Lysinibacillus capsici]
MIHVEYTKSSTVGEIEVYESFKGNVKEIAELNKALSIKETGVKPNFSDSNHVQVIGIESNKSEINYHDFSYVDLRIVFSANSPQETDLALCEIVEKATQFFQVNSVGKYGFRVPGEEEKNLVEKINECPEGPTIQATKIELETGLIIEKE